MRMTRRLTHNASGELTLVLLLILLTLLRISGAASPEAVNSTEEVHNTTLPVTSRGRLLFSISSRLPRRNRWRQTSTSVSKTIRSSVGDDDVSFGGQTRDLSVPLGPPLHPNEATTTERSLFNSKRQSHPPGFGPPGSIHPPSIGPPSIGPPSINPPSIGSPSIGPPSIRPPSSALGDGTSLFGPSLGPSSIPRPPAAALPPAPRPPSFSRPLAKPPQLPSLPRPPAPPLPPAAPSPPAPPKPPAIMPPATMLSSDEPQVTGIRCVVGRRIGTLKAIITIPSGTNTVPLLHKNPSVDLLTDPSCSVRSSFNNVLNLVITDLERCGVEECSEGSKPYLCLTLRFPVLAGLRLPEDPLVDIRCEPQDPTAEDTHAVSITTSQQSNSEREASVFEGGGQNFQCEIALFRKDPSSGGFTQRVLEDTQLELGEEVQLWSIVKANDGWEFSRMVEVVVHRSGSSPSSNPRNTAVLVFPDGCNNPTYEAIAQDKPEQNTRNRLLNKFTFRVFLFQDMQPGDTIMITAKVVGCVEEQDCLEPTHCAGFDGGSRRKREIRDTTTAAPTLSPPTSGTLAPEGEGPGGTPGPSPPPRAPYKTGPAPPGIMHHNSLFNSTKDWQRSIAINIKNPNALPSKLAFSPPQCEIYLFLTVGVACAFFLATVVFVITLFARRRKLFKESASSTATSTSSIDARDGKRVQTLQSKSPTEVSNSLSSLSSNKSEISDTTDAEEGFPWLPEVIVPATVRQRKRKLNTELMDTFQSGTLPLPSCPALLNYYGYMVVPRKAPPSQFGSQGRVSKAKRCKPLHGTLDRHFDAAVLREMESDYEETFCKVVDSREKSHKHRYKRKQRNADRSRSREARRNSHPRQDKSPNRFTYHSPDRRPGEKHQTLIRIPPPSPPVRPAPRLARPDRLSDDHFYEVPQESKPVMV